ncbi:MAG TPA: DUF2974 domain-containing protein [Clostridium sp.]|nr:DUF2974 domain-containing protein [Clostridium sp.]
MEYVIANAGTEPTSLIDWENNLKQPFGKSEDMINSLKYAKEFVKEHRNSNITFVGHSKGGAEAAGNAVLTNRNAMIFNPATVFLEAYGLKKSDYDAEMTAYIVEDEILNNIFGLISIPIDTAVYLPTQHLADTGIPIIDTINSVKNHSMKATIEAIEEWEGK